jgi:hypothetical protein
MKNRTRPLCVEPVEDRLVPSSVFGSFGSPVDPVWNEKIEVPPHAVSRSVANDRLNVTDMFNASEYDERINVGFSAPNSRPVVIVVEWIPDRIDLTKVHSTILPQPKLPEIPGPERMVAAGEGLPGETPKAASIRPNVQAVQSQSPTGSSSASPTNGFPVRLVLPSNGTVQNPVSELSNRTSSLPPNSNHEQQEVRNETPFGWVLVPGGVLSEGTPVVTGENLPAVPSSSLPEPPTLARPVETVIDRVMDAVIPNEDPIIGIVPVAPIPGGAAAVLTRLGSLAKSATDEWATPERWAWISAVVLTTAGVLASARPRRKKVLFASPGAGSGLARWEDRYDSGSA